MLYTFGGVRNDDTDTDTKIHNTNTIQAKTGGLCCSGPNAFINFLTSILRHEERDAILESLC